LHQLFVHGWLLNGHDPTDDDSTTPWDGRRLTLPAHVHARGHGLNLDFQLEERDGDEWVFRATPRLALPVAASVASSKWGVPTLVPEVILFYKAQGTIRDHDRADFDLLAPLLDVDARAWLRDAIEATHVDHPWLKGLA
jgi:hypothetical protein